MKDLRPVFIKINSIFFVETLHLSRPAYFAKGKMPNPRTRERIITNKKQMCFKKMYHFFAIFASMRSNISASRQNLVSNIRDIKMRNLIAKLELCSFNTEVAFQVTDGHQKII